MKEPTYKHYLILIDIQKEGFHLKTGKEDNIELYWELIRSHYLDKVVIFSEYDWKFTLTEKAEEYIGGLAKFIEEHL